MFNPVFHLKTFGVRSFHATSTRLSSALTRARISKLLAILSKETREPLWNSISQTSRFSPLRVPFDEFTQWHSVTRQHDIESALTTLETSQIPRIPPWVVFYIILYKVRSSVHADGPMLDFLFAHLDHLPLHHQGPLLIFAALHLSKFNLLQPLKRVVNTFLTTELSHEPLQFNLLLQALTLNSVRSTESADLVVQILTAMDGRQLKLRADTYRLLINDRFITVQLTKHLRSRMTHEGVVPNARHLESYLRVFAKGGAIHEAQTYFDAIRKNKEAVPVDDPQSTVALSGFKDRSSAFEFLEGLAPDMRQYPRPVDPYLFHIDKRRLDAHNYTASLAVVARDPEMDVQLLIRMFRRMLTMRGSAVRPTIVSYTVVIRGLLYRKSIKNAERLWNELQRGRFVLDRPALTVGLETLTYAGKPHEAFELLERHASRGAQEVPSLFARGALVDIHVLNAFMGALTKMKRPDVVFKLWDYMGELYAVYPTCETLSVVLEAARIACQLDDTLHGALSHLSLCNPFRRPVRQPTVRDEIVDAIKAVVGDGASGVVRYSSGIWNDARPFEAVRVVFLQAVFGNGREKLADVEPPAFALRRSLDADDVVLGLPAAAPPQGSGEMELPANLLNAKGRSWFPHIIPTNDNFQKYLLLLGLNKRAYEIPITLAWMRASGVRPDKATLAIAMVFWAEVSRHAPLVEEWTGGEAKSQFQRLWNWAEDWVGEDKMPTPDNVGRWLRRTKRMIEGEE